MEKHKLGWLINGALVVGTIVIGAIFPNPAVIFPVVAGAALTGTVQSMFTIAESKGEREERERRTHAKQIAASENGIKPQKEYQGLHSNKNQATFKGEHTQNWGDGRSNVTKPEAREAAEGKGGAVFSSIGGTAKTGGKQTKADSSMANEEPTLEG